MGMSAPELDEAWDRALGDPERLRARAEAFAERLRSERLAFGERLVCSVLRPLILDEAVYDRLIEDATGVVDSLHAVARGADAEAALRFSPAESELFALDPPDIRPDALGRLDAFIAPDGYPRFIEYNGESPGGVAFGDALGRAFDALDEQLLLAQHAKRVPVMRRVLRALLDNFARWARQRGRSDARPQACAIVDFGEAKTRREFELFAALFRDEGLETVIADPAELSLEEGRLRVRGLEVDLIYRRLLTTDILAEPTRSRPLVEVARRQLAYIGNGFGGHRLAHKGLFALLSDPRTRPSGTSEARHRLLDRAIPWTRLWRRGQQTIDLEGAERALASVALSEQERLVLKPASDYGGRGVVLGWKVDAETWQAALASALELGDHILQARVSIPRADFPTLSGERRTLSIDIGPYVFGGAEVEGAGIRLAEGDLLNVSAGAGSAVPLYLSRK
jgi:hypothetical protein